MGDNWRRQTVTVDLSDVIDLDLEGFLDLISERAYGTPLAQDIEYEIVGHGLHSVQLEVVANIPDDDDD